MAQRSTKVTPEHIRLAEDIARSKNWKRWGPYLAERQWATVREDYSPNGECWDYFPHDHSRSRAYRWGEDGIMGITDRECRLCFALAMWNGEDPILKERLFGLTGPEGNHAEDVKELYYYLDSTPTHSWMQGLYKYPQREFPYSHLVGENRRRGRQEAEFELADTGIFDDGRYWDVYAEYAKAGPDDILIRVRVVNRGPEAASLHMIPTLWYRNTWSWGCKHEGCTMKPLLVREGDHSVVGTHETLGASRFDVEPIAGVETEMLFTDNHTNLERLYGVPNTDRWQKDAFHRRLLHGDVDATNPKGRGTKVGFVHKLTVPAGGEAVIRMRLRGDEAKGEPFGKDFDREFGTRRKEADEFFAEVLPTSMKKEERNVARQAYAGLLWSKQFYHYIVEDWLDGDPEMPTPPESRRQGRNADWKHLFNRDIISMPDKWEYPWYAAWDLAFHMIPFAAVDPEFAKGQLLLLLREWFMAPNGQLPAYEFAFGDVNPPVHAWAAWRVYKMTGPRGERDTLFLERVFQKLLMNFTWWVNRKDPSGRNIFAGGFLGLDNIGVFDRSQPLPTGGWLEQADGTAWMAFYCATMLAIALELAQVNPAYEDIASKFFEHFVSISDALNTLGGSGLWNDEDGFYYDQVRLHGEAIPLRVRSLVGVIALFSVEVVEEDTLRKLPGFQKRMMWFLEYRTDLSRHISWMTKQECGKGESPKRWLLALPSRDRLTRVLSRVLDEAEFLSPFGIRSLSKSHEEEPYVLFADGRRYEVEYTPGESTTGVFGGNSNWRGPIWFPLNYLLIESLERYHFFYGDDFQIEMPTGSGKMMNLKQVADEISRRLSSIFLPGKDGVRPCHSADPIYAKRPEFRELALFHEYFHGDSGRGVGASHQTGWTALVARLLSSSTPSGSSPKDTFRAPK